MALPINRNPRGTAPAPSAVATPGRPQEARTAVPPQTVTGEAVCERGLKLKIAIADLEAEYAELKPEIEAYCESNNGFNSPLGSYSLRYTPKYQYPQAVEEMRLNLKQAEETAKATGTALVVNTSVAVVANVTKNSRPSTNGPSGASRRRIA